MVKNDHDIDDPEDSGDQVKLSVEQLYDKQNNSISIVDVRRGTAGADTTGNEFIREEAHHGFTVTNDEIVRIDSQIFIQDGGQHIKSACQDKFHTF